MPSLLSGFVISYVYLLRVLFNLRVLIHLNIEANALQAFKNRHGPKATKLFHGDLGLVLQMSLDKKAPAQ